MSMNQRRWYQIDAVRRGCELPTFFLDAPDIQGIVDGETAAKVAFNLLGDGIREDTELSCNVYNRQTGYITFYRLIDGMVVAP